MLDQYHRTIDYLRISVTDRCNFRCRYCMPEEGVESIAHTDILTYDEILRLGRIAAGLGITKIKITGGEPLVRKGVCDLIREIRKIPEITSVTITTNGALLPQYLEELLQAGITGINISLDTLDAEKFAFITRRDELETVKEGIQRAEKSGVKVKINCVPMKDFNENDLPELAALAKDSDLCVRFIEMMPIGLGACGQCISEDQVRAQIEERYGKLMEVTETQGNGPAKYYQAAGFRGKFGFISAVSHEFCSECNRIRLTADGILKPCLNYESHIDLRAALRSGADDETLTELFRKGIYEKPARHGFEAEWDEELHEHRKMSGIGG